MTPSTRRAGTLRIVGLAFLLALTMIACSVDNPCVGDGCPTDGGADASTRDAGDSPIEEEDGGCVAGGCLPQSCAALDCGAHRVCELTSLGPICLDECDPGFEFDETSGACVACAEPDCGPPPTCEMGVPGSIVDECQSAHRECVAVGAIAACGDCIEGHHADLETATCVEDVVCTPETCPEGDACPEGYAHEFDDDTCSQCSYVGDCGYAGEAGKVHEVRDILDQCVCSTLPGYYWSFTQRVARHCDEDGDGWVSRSAYGAITSNDEAIAAVASCTLRTVDRVVLENEYGQRKTVFLCDEGLLAEDDPKAASCTPAPLPLVESDRNDSDVALAAVQNQSRVPVYGSGLDARRFRASELNALTKGCFSAAADFDDASGPDIDQGQPFLMLSGLDRWLAFTYFMELHTSSYGFPAMVGSAGTLLIRERSRCADQEGASELPLGYADDASEYYRECTRQRDARYDADASEPGFDFARWSCDEDRCEVTPPPIGTAVGEDGALLHGLCNSGLPFDGDFLGMHHHSQFKCVLVSGESDREPYEVSLEAIHSGSSGHLDFQTCSTSKDPSAPTFACERSTTPSYGAVGWAAVRYSDTLDYEGAESLAPLPGEDPPPLHDVAGCVSEAKWAPLFCPPDAPRFEDWVLRGYGDSANFGKLVCGCTPEDAAGPDLPDAVAFDQNCDGIDGVVADTIFVDHATGNDASTGAPTDPVATIGQGIVRAQQRGRHHVAVSRGSYRERVMLVDGISIHGEYDAADGWSRDDEDVTTILRTEADVLDGRIEGVVASGITSLTVLERFTITAGSNAAPSPAGTSVYGVRVVGSSAGASGGLTLRDLVVTAGRAANGAFRGHGSTGAQGYGGASANGPSPGAGGTNPHCGGADGGRGGMGGEDTTHWACNSNNVGTGDVGTLPHNGSTYASHCNVGSAGLGGRACSPDRRDGGGGGTGWGCGAGNPGRAAGALQDVGNVKDGVYVPFTATTAGTGGPGWGGSGGGGAGSGDGQAGGNGGRGGGGGGGGAGGCGGAGGLGGSGGGGSFGLFMVDSAGVSISASTFESGPGGSGGAGGMGGVGGPGRNPGSGGNGGASGGSFPVAAGNGGGGGWGSSGGFGGAASGGGGGPSVAQLLCGSTTVVPLTTATGTAGAAGSPGAGGHRPNVTIAPNGPVAPSLALLSFSSTTCTL